MNPLISYRCCFRRWGFHCPLYAILICRSFRSFARQESQRHRFDWTKSFTPKRSLQKTIPTPESSSSKYSSWKTLFHFPGCRDQISRCASKKLRMQLLVSDYMTDGSFPVFVGNRNGKASLIHFIMHRCGWIPRVLVQGK